MQEIKKDGQIKINGVIEPISIGNAEARFIRANGKCRLQWIIEKRDTFKGFTGYCEKCGVGIFIGRFEGND